MILITIAIIMIIMITIRIMTIILTLIITTTINNNNNNTDNYHYYFFYPKANKSVVFFVEFDPVRPDTGVSGSGRRLVFADLPGSVLSQTLMKFLSALRRFSVFYYRNFFLSLLLLLFIVRLYSFHRLWSSL